jgi:beta-lactamase class C
LNTLKKFGGRPAIAAATITAATIAVTVACLFPLAGRAADDIARLRAAVDAAILPLMAQDDVPGMAVAVTVAGHAYFFNYGVASRESRTPVSEATLFELGSLSKTFTATLASYAQVMGKLSFDDHPGRFMPPLAGSAIDRASLLNLGTYTAGGLPLQFPDELSDKAGDEGLSDYFRQWQPEAAPGIERRYSNPSIGLFGHIAGIALGGDFADKAEAQLFPPLGLKSTYIRVPPGAMGRYAWGYRDNKAVRVNPGPYADEAYGVKSTSADLLRFVQLNIDPHRLDGPMRRAVEATHLAYFQVGGMAQGLGWEQYAYPVSLPDLLAGNSTTMAMEVNAVTPLVPPRQPAGKVLFNKTGSTNGFGAYAAFVPQAGIGIVMLANKNVPIPDRVKAAYAILAQLAPKGRE